MRKRNISIAFAFIIIMISISACGKNKKTEEPVYINADIQQSTYVEEKKSPYELVETKEERPGVSNLPDDQETDMSATEQTNLENILDEIMEETDEKQ